MPVYYIFHAKYNIHHAVYFFSTKKERKNIAFVLPFFPIFPTHISTWYSDMKVVFGCNPPGKTNFTLSDFKPPLPPPLIMQDLIWKQTIYIFNLQELQSAQVSTVISHKLKMPFFHKLDRPESNEIYAEIQCPLFLAMGDTPK